MISELDITYRVIYKGNLVETEEIELGLKLNFIYLEPLDVS